MLQQFAGKPLEGVAAAARDGLEALMDRFEQLPLYFMAFHGGTDVDQVVEAMVYWHSTAELHTFRFDVRLDLMHVASSSQAIHCAATLAHCARPVYCMQHAGA
eukprot:8119-Heterococcus_DN1.PRE.3